MKMDRYISQETLMGIWKYMRWNDLRMHENVPDSIWEDMLEYYYKNACFRDNFHRYWNTEKIRWVPHKELLLFFINHMLHLYIKWANDIDILNYDPIELLFGDDKFFVALAIQHNSKLFKHISQILKADPEIASLATKDNIHMLRFVDATLKSNRAFILDIVKRDWHALMYTDETLKSNAEIILAAMSQSNDALQYANPELLKDRNFQIAALYYREKWLLDG